jgi:hypothetical protein
MQYEVLEEVLVILVRMEVVSMSVVCNRASRDAKKTRITRKLNSGDRRDEIKRRACSLETVSEKCGEIWEERTGSGPCSLSSALTHRRTFATWPRS